MHKTNAGLLAAPICHLACKSTVKRPFVSHAEPQRLGRPEPATQTTRHSARNQRSYTCAALPETTDVVIVGAGKSFDATIRLSAFLTHALRGQGMLPTCLQTANS